MANRATHEYEELFDAAHSAFEQAGVIYVCGHTNADGDSWGSELALVLYLQDAYPTKTVIALSADNRGPVQDFQFLPASQEVKLPSDVREAPSVFVSVDTPNINRLNKAASLFQAAEITVAFDHHQKEDDFADILIQDNTIASTSSLILHFFQHIGAEISSNIALNLYCGLMTDTGRFQFQNTTPEVFADAQILVEAGARPAYVARSIYQEDSLAYLHLLSKVLARTEILLEGRLSYSYLLSKDLEEAGASKDDLGGFVDYVRSCKGVEVALFLRELPQEHAVRGNLRAKGNVDVSAVAKELGGGGHVAAAGFTLQGSVDAVLKATLEPLEVALEKAQLDSTCEEPSS